LKLRVTSHSSSKLATSNSLASPESSVLHYLILFLLCIVVFHSLSVRHYLCFLLVFELLSVHNSETATLKQGLHLPRFDLQRLSTPPAFATPLHISLASTGRFCHFSTKEQTNPSAKQKHLSHPHTTHPPTTMSTLTPRQGSTGLDDDGSAYYGYDSSGCYNAGTCSWWWSDVSKLRAPNHHQTP
jgi:hypothetical protein